MSQCGWTSLSGDLETRINCGLADGHAVKHKCVYCCMAAERGEQPRADCYYCNRTWSPGKAVDVSGRTGWGRV